MKNSRTEKISIIDSVIKRIWKEDLSRDYNNGYLLKEDPMKNAFYFHLRNRLGEAFLLNNNLRIFTEFHMEGQRVDLVIVEINPDLIWKESLEDCVIDIVATIEMKFKGQGVNESPFYKDIEKVIQYINGWGVNTKHYLAFIQEKYFIKDEITSWLSDEQINSSKGKLVELYSYWDYETDESEWIVKEY